MSEIGRCSTCLMPRSTRGFTFDEHGDCPLCVEHARHPEAADDPAAAARLERTIAEVRRRGAGAPFDCLVGVSGGMDSVYLLHRLTKRHGLRCLALYYRTPFTPPEIHENVVNVTARLGVPLVEMELSREEHRRVAADFVRMWERKPDQVLVNLACAPCKLMHREMFRIARLRGAPTIVHGDNRFEHANIAAGQLRTNALDRYALPANLLRLGVLATRGAATLWRHPAVLRHGGLVFRAAVLYLNPYTAYLRLRYPRIHVFNYFQDGTWDERELDAVLDELGWRMPAGFHSKKKADCTFAHLKNVMSQASTGANYLDCFYSNMVRLGVLGRAEALARLEREGRPPEGAIAEACRTLGWTPDCVRK